jgi:hypothetical protein
MLVSDGIDTATVILPEGLRAECFSQQDTAQTTEGVENKIFIRLESFAVAVVDDVM